MNKTDLTAAIAEQTDLTKAQADAAVTAAIDIIRTVVAAGEPVTIAGLGAFEAIYREARNGRNPQTGAPLQIAGVWAPKFKPFDGFKSLVRESQSLVNA
ncbi:HU family DNA-binding protein [Streptosporangium sp. NPDC049078]|uniref:HU family DNA-binding protein n=1 Tax=Streptosporangium sp. NPDC049078 TaxID=3155767 RepID=UPI0034441F59